MEMLTESVIFFKPFTERQYSGTTVFTHQRFSQKLYFADFANKIDFVLIKSAIMFFMLQLSAVTL